MSLSDMSCNGIGDDLFNALRKRETIEPPSTQHNGMTIDDAYQVSRHFLARRQTEGEKVVGKKIGVTSAAVQDMLGVHQPDFGFLTDVMQVPDGGTVSLAAHNLIQPRAEGEIAFVLARDIQGPDVTEADVIAATDYVCPCFEIVDSRITDWRIAIQDTIADNASCGVFLLGEARADPNALDLAEVAMTIQKNGEHAAEGKGSAVQGHPATAIAWLANTLGAYGIPLLAGEIILSGSLAPLLPARAGDHFHLSLEGIGEAEVTFAA